jgi:hypothetical protein
MELSKEQILNETTSYQLPENLAHGVYAFVISSKHEKKTLKIVL